MNPDPPSITCVPYVTWSFNSFRKKNNLENYKPAKFSVSKYIFNYFKHYFINLLRKKIECVAKYHFFKLLPVMRTKCNSISAREDSTKSTRAKKVII